MPGVHLPDAGAVVLATGTPQLHCVVREHVAVITLDRPDARNALSDELTPALRGILRHCAADAGIRCVLVTGAGAAFCAGGDVKGMGAASRTDRTLEERVAELQVRQRTLTGALAGLRQPTIAALPGVAAGAGLALALACDIRLAAQSAFVTTGYARMALTGDYGISSLLTRVVGTARARELMFTARRVAADACLAMGLVHEVLPDHMLAARAFALARELAAGPAAALAAIKQNLDDALVLDLQASMDREAQRLLQAAAGADHAEAVRAFVEKRPARFAQAAPHATPDHLPPADAPAPTRGHAP